MNNFALFTIASALAQVAAVEGASLVLNFGNVSQPGFGSTNNRINYTTVATGVNASMFAENNFTSVKPADNGSAAGDVRVNAAIGQTVTLRIQLWDANSGTGFDTPFSPGQSYTWSLMFYDVDSITTNPNATSNRWDVVTVLTPGNYTVTTATAIAIDKSVPNQVTFSGRVGGDVAGQAGLGNPITNAQANVAVRYDVVDSSVARFIYSVGGNTGNDRALLVDGGEITFGGRSTITQPVPEPSILMVLGLSSLGIALRRRRH